MQCRGVGPHLGAKGKSHCLSRVAAETWVIFSSDGGCSFKTRVSSATSGPLSNYEGKLRNLLKAWQGNMDTSRGEAGQRDFLSICPVILGFVSIFKKSQALPPFEALNSAWLSRCQKDVRPPVQMRQGPGAFSKVSTGDSDIPSSCEMKDGPAFKPPQGNPAFCRVRASRCPFHLRQQIQGHSNIPLAEGRLLLRCLWKVGIPLQLTPGNQLSSRDDMGCKELSSS